MRRAALAVLCGVFAAACERKAPGPEECRRFALVLSGVPADPERTDVRLAPAVREHVDAVTRDCLVVPYDRELLRCTVETGRARACRAAFERRRARRDERGGVL